MILWSLILIVSFKYAILILRADNRSEGGIMALSKADGSLQAHGHDLCGQLDIVAHAVEIISRL